MKIIIKESQLENVVFKFLDTQLNPHEVVIIPSKGRIRKRTFWVKNNIVIAEVEIFKGEKTFWLDKQIFNGFQSAFSLGQKVALDYIDKYIENYHGLVNYKNVPHDMWVEQEYYNNFIENQN